jgi:hypothetical protein
MPWKKPGQAASAPPQYPHQTENLLNNLSAYLLSTCASFARAVGGTREEALTTLMLLSSHLSVLCQLPWLHSGWSM